MSDAIYNECDPHAADWLANLITAGHVAPGRVERRSIVALRPEDVVGLGQRHFFAGIGGWSHALRLAGVPDDASLWTGSCPCQPFSLAGRRRGFRDDRHLWPEWFRLIRICRPAVLLGEQVEGPAGRAWLDAVLADLEGAGYACGAAVLPAAGVGAPHARHRIYFVAIANAAGREHLRGLRLSGDGNEARGDDTDGRGTALGLDDTACKRFAGRDGGGGSGSRRETDHASGMGDDGREGLAGHAGDDRTALGRERSDGPAPAAGDARGMGDACQLRAGWDAGAVPSAEAPRPGERVVAESLHHAGFDAGATRGSWSGADWIWCRDEKWRPVEPGSLPLVDGTAFRLGSGSAWEGKSRAGLLRGYGNAIVPQVAAEFIRAVREALT